MRGRKNKLFNYIINVQILRIILKPCIWETKVKVVKRQIVSSAYLAQMGAQLI